MFADRTTNALTAHANSARATTREKPWRGSKRAGHLTTGVLGLLLAGCGALPKPPSEQVIEYHSFDAASRTPASSQTRPAPSDGPVMLVSLPLAAVAYESPRMAYTRNEREISYYGRSEWIGPPARLLEPMLVRALEGTGAFRAVTTGTNGLLSDLRLDVEIYELMQHFGTTGSEGRVALRIQVIDLAREHLLAARTFSSTAPAPSADPRGGAEAITIAMNNVLSSVADFVASLAGD